MVRHNLFILILLGALLLLQAPVTAQQPDTGVPVVTTRDLAIPLSDAPQRVAFASTQVTGNPGRAVYYYWIVTRATVGASSPAGPFLIQTAPDTLSASNYVTISWQPSLGAASYDVLRTTTSSSPAGACNCAVATAVSGTAQTDQSNSLNAYTVASLDPATLTIHVTNQATGAGASQLKQTQNGVTTALGGGASPGGVGTELQRRGGASTLSAVTGSSVSGADITLTGTITANTLAVTGGAGTLATFTGGNATGTNPLVSVVGGATDTGTGFGVSVSTGLAGNGIDVNRIAAGTGSRCLRLRDNSVETFFVTCAGAMQATSITGTSWVLTETGGGVDTWTIQANAAVTSSFSWIGPAAAAAAQSAVEISAAGQLSYTAFTGTGNIMKAISPTTTGTLTAENITMTTGTFTTAGLITYAGGHIVRATAGNNMTVQSTGGNGRVILDTAGTGFVQSTGNTLFVASDFTTSGVGTALEAITGLTWTMPGSTALNLNFQCNLIYNQNVGTAAVAFGIRDVTTAPTQINAQGTLWTSASVAAAGNLIGLATTTATAIVSGTPSVITTTWNAQLAGMIEQPSGAASAIQIMVSTATAANTVTVKRGSYCRIY